MKNLIARILVIGTALGGVVAVNAAQITANVPFNFYVGSAVMPQDAYRVAEVSNGAVVALKTMHATKAIITSNLTGKSLNETQRMVFHRYGDTYFLAEIWSGDGSIGHALWRSAREKELAQN